MSSIIFLEDEICALKILPGEALSETACKRFGVSRTYPQGFAAAESRTALCRSFPQARHCYRHRHRRVVDQLIFQRVAVEGMVFLGLCAELPPMEILAVEHLYNMPLEGCGRSDPENF